MMQSPQTSLTIFLPSEADTARLGEVLADIVTPGMTVLLAGPIGAGKTHLARALIRARLGRTEDVPSPTFTLVQVYEDARGDIWHADLYRLSHPDEVTELGLEVAFETAICVVEWPDRLGRMVPTNAIRVKLDAQGEGRVAVLTGDHGLIEDLSGLWESGGA